jgi:hypothetical protein
MGSEQRNRGSVFRYSTVDTATGVNNVRQFRYLFDGFAGRKRRKRRPAFTDYAMYGQASQNKSWRKLGPTSDLASLPLLTCVHGPVLFQDITKVWRRERRVPPHRGQRKRFVLHPAYDVVLYIIACTNKRLPRGSLLFSSEVILAGPFYR